MSFYLPDEEDFVKRIKNLKEQALNNNKITLLKFLDCRKQDLIKYIIGNKNEVYAYFNGGFSNAEYKKCLITPFDDEKNDFAIIIFKIIYNEKYLKLNHRNILGTLMSLGIKRENIGDIIIDEDDCYFACSKEISEFLNLEFRTINNVPIILQEVRDIVIDKIDDYDIKKSFVSSLRLDIILSAMYNLSRSESQRLIIDKQVKVNHVVNCNVSQILKVDDLLSITGKGRMKLFSVGSMTSKGRIIVEIGCLR